MEAKPAGVGLGRRVRILPPCLRSPPENIEFMFWIDPPKPIEVSGDFVVDRSVPDIFHRF